MEIDTNIVVDIDVNSTDVIDPVVNEINDTSIISISCDILTNDVPTVRPKPKVLRKRRRSVSPSTRSNVSTNTVSNQRKKKVSKPTNLTKASSEPNSMAVSHLQSKVVGRNITATSNPNKNLNSKVANGDFGHRVGHTINSKLYETKTVYISPFRPDTTVDDITDHLKSHQCYSVVGDLKVIKLVSQNKDTRKLSFVSFKIEVPNHYFDIIMDSSIWPPGVKAKEFVENSLPGKKTLNQFHLPNEP
ncbi:uncharacterized protein LOC116349613 [Contarinia nasturtii]|uniref:uncharacterized protein LOC116349613 n=1 Tax=Contarinia nasturtii TaxID=265458 RepID=UPI0012D39783|nr:uncharacterized protein LOC116349613 [Contarinia nasturtii]